MWGQKEKTETQEQNIPETPFQETEPQAPDQCGPDETERQDDISSPAPENVKEEKKTPKEKTQTQLRIIPEDQWDEISARLEEEGKKRLRGLSVDAAIRKHRGMVTQLRDRGMTDIDIAEMFSGVFGFEVEPREVTKAMKPKRKRTKKTKDTETETQENIITVPEEKDTAEEAAI